MKHRTAQELKLAFTIEQAVNISGVSRDGLYKAIRAGLIIPKTYGKRTLIPRERLETFMQALPDQTPDMPRKHGRPRKQRAA